MLLPRGTAVSGGDRTPMNSSAAPCRMVLYVTAGIKVANKMLALSLQGFCMGACVTTRY